MKPPLKLSDLNDRKVYDRIRRKLMPKRRNDDAKWEALSREIERNPICGPRPR